MNVAVARPSADSQLIGKKELAAALGWSRSRLDRRLNEDASFPVVTRGDRSGGWSFDLAGVTGYLDGRPQLPLARPVAVAVSEIEAAEPEPEAAPVTAPPARHAGEVTSRQLRDHADADLKIDRLRRIRGDLVEAAELRAVVSTLLVEMRSQLLSMPDALVREFGLSERVGFAMKGKVEAMMRASVQKVRLELNVTPPPPPSDDA